jgi:hypothetical protein
MTTEKHIDLGHRDQACQQAFGNPDLFFVYLRKSD